MKNENNSSLANSTTADSKTSNANIGVLKRRLRKEAKDKYWNYKPQDAVEGPMDPNNPPKEGMYFEYFVMSWVPMAFDKEAFIKEKEAVIEAEYQRSLDITPNPNTPGFSLSGKAIHSEPEDTVNFENGLSLGTEVTSTTVNQEQWYTSRIIEPNDEEQITETEKAKEELPMPSCEPTESILPTAIEDSSEENTSRISQEEPVSNPSSELDSEPLPEAVEQSKKTRRSARMDEADFDILASQFIYPTDLAEKKPLFFPTDIRESLKLVARLIPGGKVSPSHIAIHIIRAWLDENRDLLNRMLSSQKLSI